MGNTQETIPLLESVFFEGAIFEEVGFGFYIDWQGFKGTLAHKEGALWDAQLRMFGFDLVSSEATPEDALRALKRRVQEAISRFLASDPELGRPEVARDVGAEARRINRKLYYDLAKCEDSDQQCKTLTEVFEALFASKDYELANTVLANLAPLTIGRDPALHLAIITAEHASLLRSREPFVERLHRAFPSDMARE